MATKTASIRLTLDSGSFSASFSSLAGRVASIGKTMGASISTPLNAGFTAAKRSLTDMGSHLKSTIRNYSTMAGAIATGILTKDALQLRSAFGKLAFSLNKVSDKTVTWEAVQRDVNKAADLSAQKAETMVDIYGQLFKATGDAEFSRDVLEAIGTAATASGEDINNLTTGVQMMSRKFGISAAKIPEALASLIQMTGAGALQLDELTGKFGILAGEAADAGMAGTQGMRDLLGIFKILDPKMGEKMIQPMTMMIQKLKSGSPLLKELKKNAGIKLTPEMGFFDKLSKIVGSKKARAIVEAKFGGVARGAFDKLVEPFDTAWKEAEGRGLKKAAQMDYALGALQKSFQTAATTTMTYSDLQKLAAKKMESDPSVRLRVAIGKMEEAIATPKMIDALRKLATIAPIIADKFADLVKWAAENPWRAVGVAAGVKMGIPAATAMLGTGGAMVMKSIGTKLLAGGAAAAGGLLGAAKAAGTALLGSGAAAAAGAAPAVGAATALPAAAGAGTTAGIGAGMAAIGAVAAAGAAGAGVGYAGYKFGIEPELEAWSKKLRSMDELLIDAETALRSKRVPNAKSLGAVLGKIQAAKQTSEPGLIVKTLSALSTGESADKQRAERVAKLAMAEKQLITILQDLASGADSAAGSLHKVGGAMPASIPGISNKYSATRGVRAPANNLPGAIPGNMG